MSETDEAVKLLPPPVQRYIVLAKAVPKWVAAAILAIIPAVSAYRSATGDAAQRAQVVKNKSEAGYQVTRAAMEALEHRVLVLEQAARVAQIPRKGARRSPLPIPVAVTTHPKALPADLDQAARQIYKGAPPAPPRAPDAAPGKVE